MGFFTDLLHLIENPPRRWEESATQEQKDEIEKRKKQFVEAARNCAGILKE